VYAKKVNTDSSNLGPKVGYSIWKMSRSWPVWIDTLQ